MLLNEEYLIEEKIRNKIKSYAKNKGFEVFNAAKNKSAKETSDYISKALKELFDEVFATEKFKTFKIIKAIGLSALTIIATILVNSFFLGFLVGAGISAVVAQGLTTIICAPLVEEMQKRINIKKGGGLINVILFNTVEFSIYVSRMLNMGFSLPLAVLIRTPPMLLHFGNTVLQKAHIIQAREMKDEKIEKAGYWSAVIVHAIGNTMASFNAPLTLAAQAVYGLRMANLIGKEKKKEFENKVKSKLQLAKK